MATYRNGIETREALYNSARHNFSKQGYNNASIKDIVSDINSKLGLFTYYFESKESLALSILDDLQKAVIDATDRAEGVERVKSNPLVLELVHTRVLLLALAQYKHVARFVKEICSTSANLARNVQHIDALCKMLRVHDTALWEPDKLFNADANALMVMLMSGMLMQFSHDMASLHFTAPMDDVIDSFLAAYMGICIQDKAGLTDAIRASREAVCDVHLLIDEDFQVSYK